MSRRVAAAAGALLAAIGFVLALISLAVPWARYRVRVDVPAGDADLERAGGIAVFQLHFGWWYVVALFVLLGLVAGAAAAQGTAARVASVAGIAVGVIGMLAASAVAARVAGASVGSLARGLAILDVQAERADGAGYGVAAPLLLALGGALLSVRTARPAARQPGPSDIDASRARLPR